MQNMGPDPGEAKMTKVSKYKSTSPRSLGFSLTSTYENGLSTKQCVIRDKIFARRVQRTRESF